MAELANARFPKIYQDFPTETVETDDILLIYKPSTGKTHGILGINVIPNSDVSNYQWVSTATYDTGDPVLSNNKWWVSLIDSNTGNIPSENANWTQVNRISGSSLRKWTAGLYVNDDEYVVYGGVLYELNASPGTARPYNSTTNPSVDTANWTIVNNFRLVTGALIDLTTTDKTNLVAAINEIKAALAGFGNLSDTDIDTLAELNAILTDSNLLAAGNNLSDLVNVATARTNIGLGNVDNTSDVNKPVSTAQQAALDLKSNKLLTANRQTASYTLVLTDADKLVEMNVASANNLTVPPNSSVAFSTGTQILIGQYGAGQTTVVAGSGVTIRSAGAALNLSSQYSGATLVKIGTDEWYLFGDIS